MTRKDFELIARVIADVRRDYPSDGRAQYILDRLTEDFASRLATNNEAFDPDRFWKACL